MADEEEKEEPPKKKSALVPLIAVFAVISLIAVGAGWFIGSQVRTAMDGLAAEAAADGPKMAAKTSDEDEMAAIGSKDEKPKKASASGDDESDEESGGLFSSGPSTIRLDPVVTNLGQEKGQWIRMEVAVIYRKGADTPGDAEKMAINEAIIGMLRSKDAEDLSGPSGYQHFREDLIDTVLLNTGGKARDAKILSLVVE